MEPTPLTLSEPVAPDPTRAFEPGRRASPSHLPTNQPIPPLKAKPRGGVRPTPSIASHTGPGLQSENHGATTLFDLCPVITPHHLPSTVPLPSPFPPSIALRSVGRPPRAFLHVQGAAGAARPGPGGGGGGGGRPRGCVAAGGGGAAGGVLQCDVPDRGGGGVRGDARHPARGPHAGALAAPDALPRLLCPGLRRLHHAQVPAGHGGAGRHPEPEHAGLRRHRADQGQARDALPAHRLLRRHHRHGRQGRRVPEQGAVVRRGDRAAGRQHDGGGVRGERPGAAGLQHRRRQDLLQRQVAHRQGHRRPLREPQHRDLPLRGVPEAALQLHGRHGPGPVAGRPLREAAEEALPAQPRRPGQEDQGAHGPRQRLHLRPQLLPPRAGHGGPLPVRRQPPPRRRHQGLRREDGQRVVARRVLPGLRGGHGQDGPHRRAPRPPRGGQGDLRRFC